MDHALEVLGKIYARVGDSPAFELASDEISFWLTGEGRKWIEQVSCEPPVFKFSSVGLKMLKNL